ncbi:hypothetical protein RGQ29_012042 [Quercus rubra]|uniref:Uncharacterized protein n=1 Tax=Quercus rubra TaxID=3512 RepID=A0AAN7J337_QUERU|nr:hypothetical protein RGQ29_012042 [Quercus rubra]
MAVKTSDNAAIYIEGLESLIKARKSQDLFMSRKCCIFKTPTILLRLNEKAYVPDVFSIGPFHHGRPEFKETEKIKTKNLTNSVKDVEREAREYYGKPIDYTPDEFVKILVIDGCFIVELFRKDFYTELREEDDPIFTMSCMRQFLFHDLILLENQVPWMVLERLFNFTLDPRHKMPLVELAQDFFGDFFVSKPRSGYPPIQDIKHILDVFRKWLVLPTEEERGHLDWALLMPSAMSLVEAGVKIKRRESKSILDIKFNNGVLEIPGLYIHEITETFFRNLICFEQCFPNCEPRFTSYAVLIDNLINTAKDVDILCENKIIDNWLNPADAVPFFNKLYYNAFLKEIYYQKFRQDLNNYCKRRWPRWRAMLLRNYFDTPWAIL